MIETGSGGILYSLCILSLSFRHSTKWSDMTGVVERLESEKLLLESRLSESQALIKNLVEQYKTQLDESQRLGNILKDVHSNH